MSTDGQGTLRRRKIAENFNRLSRAHERYRRIRDVLVHDNALYKLTFYFTFTLLYDRQTDDRQTDGRWHIANLNLSSRSLKTRKKLALARGGPALPCMATPGQRYRLSLIVERPTSISQWCTSSFDHNHLAVSIRKGILTDKQARARDT